MQLEDVSSVSLESLILKVKRGNSPLFKAAKTLYRGIQHASLPVPAVLRPVGKFLYHLYGFLWIASTRIVSGCYREPVFRCRCEQAGKRLNLALMPEAFGHTRIFIGDDLVCHGKLGIYSGRVFEEPRLIIGSRVTLGHQLNISCNQEIIIEDDVLIATSVTISDNDGHPIDAGQRAQGLPASREATRPVRIGKMTWIGHGAIILKGVTTGEGSIIGAGSIVTADVPPYTVVAGNPAKVIKILKPETQPV